jgi:hypothetical protein
MDKLSKTGKLVILGVVVVVIVALVVIYGGSRPSGSQAPAGSTSTPTSSTTSATVTDAGSIPAGNGDGVVVVPKKNTTIPTPPKGSPVSFVTPVAGATWTIDTQNTIQWSRVTEVNGIIELLNASSLQLVGVILPSVGPDQTSYTWNTRDLLQSPTSPVKTTVTPGSYVVRIIFSGNETPTITSQAITIVN